MRAGLLLAVALFLLVYHLGSKDLWDASEGRPPESAREMRQQGDFLVQYTNGDVDLTKPPLYAWLVAASFAVTGGETEWAARLPSVLATLGILIVTFHLASRVRGRRAGLFAVLLLLTQARFLWQARLAELETLLALGVVGAYLAFGQALDAEGGAKRARAFALFAAALGFAFAVKGPVALLLVLPGAVAYAVATGRGRALLRPAFLGTLPFVAAVGLPWYLAVVLRDRAALDTFVSYARGDNVGHLRDPFYYLWQYPLNALPWTPLVVLGLVFAFRAGRDPVATRRLRLPAVAFVTTFLVMSAVHAKQTHYLIPIFPMGAVLAGAWLDRALAEAPAVAGRALAVSGVVLLLAGGAVLISPALAETLPGWPTWPFAALVGLAIAAPAAWGAISAWRGAAARAFPVLVAAVVVLDAFAVGHGAPALNDAMSARRFLERVARRVPATVPLASSVFGSHSDHLWYLGRTVTLATGADVRSFLEGPGARYALVFEPEVKDLEGVATVLDQDPSFQKKNRWVVLVANAAGADRS